MRHGKKFNHLGRKSAHRKAMLSNMASSLILQENKRIYTTLAKAKALRVFVEPLINRSKDDSTHSRRVVFRYLQNKYAVSELFRNIAQKVVDRQGGYTRILKTGARLGDGAEMCFIELVDYNENMVSSSGAKTKKSRRTRRKKSKPAAEAAAKATETVDKVEEKLADAKDAVVEAKEEVKKEASKEKKDAKDTEKDA